MGNFNFEDWKEHNNKILEKWHHRVVFVPSTYKMPYEHMDVCARLDDWLMRKSKDDETVKVTLSADEVDAVRVALLIYSSALMDIHQDEIKEEMATIIRELAGKN